MQKYLEVGKIVAPHGTRGEVRVQPWCDGAEFLTGFGTLYFDGGETAVRVERARAHKGVAILKLSGTEDMDAANLLRGRVLWCDRGDVKLGERTYFVQDLLGMRVEDADDPSRVYGELTQVQPTGANDVYGVTRGGKTQWIPAIRQVVISTDVEGRVMRIRPMEGLFEDAD